MNGQKQQNKAQNHPLLTDHSSALQMIRLKLFLFSLKLLIVVVNSCRPKIRKNVKRWPKSSQRIIFARFVVYLVLISLHLVTYMLSLSFYFFGTSDLTFIIIKTYAYCELYQNRVFVSILFSDCYFSFFASDRTIPENSGDKNQRKSCRNSSS